MKDQEAPALNPSLLHRASIKPPAIAAKSATKSTPMSIRMVGLIGWICIIAGMFATTFGILPMLKHGQGAGVIMATSGIGLIVGGAFYLAAYHVAAAVIDMRNMMREEDQ